MLLCLRFDNLTAASIVTMTTRVAPAVARLILPKLAGPLRHSAPLVVRQQSAYLQQYTAILFTYNSALQSCSLTTVHCDPVHLQQCTAILFTYNSILRSCSLTTVHCDPVHLQQYTAILFTCNSALQSFSLTTVHGDAYRYHSYH